MSQSTEDALAREVVVYWVLWVNSRMWNSDKDMLGERVLVDGVSVRRVVGAMDMSR